MLDVPVCATAVTVTSVITITSSTLEADMERPPLFETRGEQPDAKPLERRVGGAAAGHRQTARTRTSLRWRQYIPIPSFVKVLSVYEIRENLWLKIYQPFLSN